MEGPRTRSRFKAAVRLRRTMHLTHTPTHIPSVNRIPDELFIEIMLLARDSGSDYVLLNLTGVCRLWRSIMLDTPTLWTRIMVYKNLDLFRLLVERSKEQPVDVTVNSSCTKFPHTATHMTLAHLILNISHRVRHLKVDNMGTRAFKFLVSGLNTPMPALEELHLRSRRRGDGIMPSNISAPRLRAFSVQGVSISMDDVFTILASFPGLERLKLEFTCSTPPGAGFVAVAAAPIRFSRLEELVLTERVPVLRYILSRITFPTTTVIGLAPWISRRFSSANDVPVLSDMCPVSDSLSYIKDAGHLQIVSACERMLVYVDSWHDGRPSSDPSKLIQLCAQLGHVLPDMCSLVPRMMVDIAHRLRGSDMRSISLEFYGPSDHVVLTSEDWMTFLYAFPHLEQLTVGMLEEYVPMLSCLAGTSEAAPLYCPGLQELRIPGFKLTVQFAALLVKMVRARAGLGVPLEKLDLQSNHMRRRLSVEEFEEIKRLVGKFKCSGDALPPPILRQLKHGDVRSPDSPYMSSGSEGSDSS